jgi:hypothetical protein
MRFSVFLKATATVVGEVTREAFTAVYRGTQSGNEGVAAV